MDLLIAFIIFLISMVGAIIMGQSMIIALLIGLICFMTVGVKRGFKLSELSRMGFAGIKESFVVLEVMCVIGMVTATWRISGTITVFVYYGIKIITPPLFLLIAFLLSSLLSYALGTSFGVAGTVGVIFMALARSGGVDPVLTAGVLLSGIYFGDRGSPASSAATLVAALTHTKMMENVKIFMKTAIPAFVISLAVYGVLSFFNPINKVDPVLVTEFEESFSLSTWAFVPAIIMMVLPLLKVSIVLSMGLSVIAGSLVAWLVQGESIKAVLMTLIVGYKAETAGLGEILNGGGVVSMLEVMGMIIISSAYSGIFDGTAMLDGIQEKLMSLCKKWGRFPVMSITSIVSAMVFCNQTVTTLICSNLLAKPYRELGASDTETAVDMGNATLLLSCMVPWCIGCSVPLAFLQTTYASVGYACYMYLVPVTYFFTKSRYFGSR